MDCGLFLLGCAVLEIQVDEVLMGNTCLLCQSLEVRNRSFIKIYCDLVLGLAVASTALAFGKTYSFLLLHLVVILTFFITRLTDRYNSDFVFINIKVNHDNHRRFGVRANQNKALFLS